MTSADDPLARYSKRAIETAAEELGLDALALARRLGDGEIGRLIHLLNAAIRHVDHAALRHRIEDILITVTDGRMPSKEPETELDWALKVTRRRREDEERQRGDEPGA